MSSASIETRGPALSWVLQEPMMRASHALLHEGRVWLIDPTHDDEALAQAVALGRPVAVVQLLDRHNRSCAQVASELGIPHLRIPDALPGTPFTIVPLVRFRLWHEIALWWPAAATLVVAEAIGTAPAYAPGPAGAGVHAVLRLRPPGALRYFAPRHLLVGHGHSLHGDEATDALRQALRRTRIDVPRAALALVRTGAQARRS